MTQAEQLNEIYTHLPAVAQQEVWDFLLFLQQRYDGEKPLMDRIVFTNKPEHSIQKNPVFGMWADIQGDSREFLKQLRKNQGHVHERCAFGYHGVD